MGLIARARLALRGIRIGTGSRIAPTVRFDGIARGGLAIGARTRILHDVRFVSSTLAASPPPMTTIGSDCVIGVRSIVHAGVTIGDGTTIATGSVVDRDVAAGSHVAGSPLRDLPRG